MFKSTVCLDHSNNLSYNSRGPVNKHFFFGADLQFDFSHFRICIYFVYSLVFLFFFCSFPCFCNSNKFLYSHMAMFKLGLQLYLNWLLKNENIKNSLKPRSLAVCSLVFFIICCLIARGSVVLCQCVRSAILVCCISVFKFRKTVDSRSVGPLARFQKPFDLRRYLFLNRAHCTILYNRSHGTNT